MSFTMQFQEEPQWCWAAVATSVKHFFSAGSGLTQCQVATPVLRGEKSIAVTTVCCLTKNACNFPAKLQDALSLAITNNLNSILGGPLSFSGAPSVRSELAYPSNRPIAARIQWLGGGGHFAVLIGYRLYNSGAELVHVADPHYGPSWVFYDDLVNAYQGDGSWTDTFLLQA